MNNTAQNPDNKIIKIVKNDTNNCFDIEYSTGARGRLDILNNHVFKYHKSPSGIFSDPEPHHPEDNAKINSKQVTEYDTEAYEKSILKDDFKSYTIVTKYIEIYFDRENDTITVFDKRTNKKVLKESEPLSYKDNKSTQTLIQHEDEYFFGGGMQNGRFTHKGQVVRIVNTNNWDEGGVTSPCPFYWSSRGYGVLRNTWQPGEYDFGSDSSKVITIHKGQDFDAFFFINSLPKDILLDYYELTGRPILMPEYAFYEAHMNCFNRDYWVKVDSKTPGAQPFAYNEFFKKYKSNEIGDRNGTLESLNGHNQFSARAMLDKYKSHDMPLGWFIPNEGCYGSGYGQTESLDGDIQNLQHFSDYAKTKYGVQVALWTEAQIEPQNPNIPEKGERDLKKEVQAGVVAFKYDIAAIKKGYSFGISLVKKANDVLVSHGQNNIRPMFLMVNGWAGIQRYSGIWSGNQTGGQWDYIRFHIPTFIGSGLSGQPVVGSALDGIYGGGSKEVNIRDFQWKTFTPLQFNIDGYGHISKTPFAFDMEAKVIKRAYLKLKSMLMPYNYTIGYQSIHGLPMVRAMFLEFPNEASAYMKDSEYQYMWGPNLLVAPIYNPKGTMDASLRNGIYLPDKDQVWIDFFTGEKYQGGKIWNNIKTPLWKIPVFVRDGAIIPMTNPNNNPHEIERDIRIFNVYPNSSTEFEVYEDDGLSTEYLDERFATTKITVTAPSSNREGKLVITIHKTEGSYANMVKHRTTILRIMASKEPDFHNITAAINKKSVKLETVVTDEEFNEDVNVCYYKENFSVHDKYLNNLDGEVGKQKFLLIKIQKTDITSKTIQIIITSFSNESKIFGNDLKVNGTLKAPSHLTVFKEAGITHLFWQTVDEAIFYEIDRDGAIFSNIVGNSFAFDDFKHEFRIRSVNNEGVSVWSNIVNANCMIKTSSHLTALRREGYFPVTLHGQPEESVASNTITRNADVYRPVKYDKAVSEWTEQNVAKQNIYPPIYAQSYTDIVKKDYTVKGVRVTCSVPCQPGQAVCRLTDGEQSNMWHTLYDYQTKKKVIKLNFDLGRDYELVKMVYTPRSDTKNGTLLKIKYRYSNDDINWKPFSEPVTWNGDDTDKEVELHREKLRFVEVVVLESVMGHGSGRHMEFHMSTNSASLPAIDPYENVVKGVQVTCMTPCQPSHEVSRLTDDNISLHHWHTKHDLSNLIDYTTGKDITLKFDLGDVYEIQKVEYYPRLDAGSGTILKFKYWYFVNPTDQGSSSEEISWNHDENVKTLRLNGAKMRYMMLIVLEAIEGHGSGRKILFFKKA